MTKRFEISRYRHGQAVQHFNVPAYGHADMRAIPDADYVKAAIPETYHKPFSRGEWSEPRASDGVSFCVMLDAGGHVMGTLYATPA